MASPILDSVFGPIPEDVLPTEDVDISDLSGQPAGSVVLTFKKASAVVQFRAEDDGAKLGGDKGIHKDWTKALGTTVALLTLCQVAPIIPRVDEEGNPIPRRSMLYEDLVQSRGIAFLEILKRFGEKFPDEGNKDSLREAIAEAKNGLKPAKDAL